MMKLVTVYVVLYDDPGRDDGVGDRIKRFRFKSDAVKFAISHTHYGQPAEVRMTEVPPRIADSWAVF